MKDTDKTCSPGRIAAEAAKALQYAGLLTLYEKSILKQTKAIIKSSVEKAWRQGWNECDQQITQHVGGMQSRAAHASECNRIAAKDDMPAAHASEPKITKADLKTTREKIPYFGHMRKYK